MSFAGMGHNRPPSDRQEPDCYCYTCSRHIHHLGIMSHRAAHRRKSEDCRIRFSTGDIRSYHFAKREG